MTPGELAKIRTFVEKFKSWGELASSEDLWWAEQTSSLVAEVERLTVERDEARQVAIARGCVLRDILSWAGDDLDDVLDSTEADAAVRSANPLPWEVES